MDKTTKTLEIKINTDEATKKLVEIEKETQKMQSFFKEAKISQDTIDAYTHMRDTLKEVTEKQEQYNNLKKQEQEIQKNLKYAKNDEEKNQLKDMLGQFKATRKQMLKEDERIKDPEKVAQEKKIQEATIKNLSKGLKKFEKDAIQVFNTLGINIKNVFGDVIKELSSMLDANTGMASYGLGTTLFTNAAAREQAMKYGLSDSQNYALTQAMSMLNMRSDEDLMYMNSAQKQKFNRLMDQYNSWYTKMSSTGLLENVQEAQLEFKMMKQEIAYKLLDWFAKNKDKIMTALQVIMKAVEVIANVIISILNAIPGAKHYSSGVDASVMANTGVVNNVNVNNTNNATAMLNNKEELQASFNNSNANLVKQIGASLLAKR